MAKWETGVLQTKKGSITFAFAVEEDRKCLVMWFMSSHAHDSEQALLISEGQFQLYLQ